MIYIVAVVAVAVALVVSFISNRIQQRNSNRNTFVDIGKHIEALLHPVSGHQRRCMAHQGGY